MDYTESRGDKITSLTSTKHPEGRYHKLAARFNGLFHGQRGDSIPTMICFREIYQIRVIRGSVVFHSDNVIDDDEDGK